MLKSHVDAVESHLLTISRIPANTGHSLHKGTPREAFIKEFLINHLSERVAIGSGEIIDAKSQPNQPRNQIDIVIYKRDYPKLDFGGGISGFLAESVVATIEVKSTLDKDAIQQSVRASRNIKTLQKNIISAFSAGYQPPGILSYVVAYDGPAKMKTVYDWISTIHQQEGIQYPQMSSNVEERAKLMSPALDAIFVLGKGFIHFDNVPVGFMDENQRIQHPQYKWVVADASSGSLLLLFLFLTLAVSGVSGSWLNPMPYLSNFRVENVSFGT